MSGRGRGLLDRMSSSDPRRRPPILKSIAANLAAILNTHEGDGYTCPTMGYDFLGLMSRWPTSESDVMAALRRAVETYEPRLRNVHVRRVGLGDDPHAIAIEISAELQNESESESRDRVRLQTQLALDGRFDVS